MTTADLALLMHHQRHDELVRAAARSALIRQARPPRTPRVRSSRLSVLAMVTGPWQRLTEHRLTESRLTGNRLTGNRLTGSRSTASVADPALCCA